MSVRVCHMAGPDSALGFLHIVRQQRPPVAGRLEARWQEDSSAHCCSLVRAYR